MATNIALTPRNNPDGKFVTATITGSGTSVILNTANDNTAPIIVEGYQQHDYSYEVASIGTNVTCALQVLLAPDSTTWVTRATKQSTANGSDIVSFTGFAYATRLVLTVITGGTPAIRNITGVGSNPYRK